MLRERSFGKVALQMYNRNLPVAVKQYKSNDLYEINNEAETKFLLQKDGHHPLLPLLLGTNTETISFLMATIFYGKTMKVRP